MRIRKRQVPFPLLPVTHSDPNLINRSPVMVQLNHATTTSLHPSCTLGSPAAPSLLLDLPQPSDQLLPPIGKSTNGSDEASGEGGTQNLRQQQHKKREEDSLVEDERREEQGGGQKGNDTRKGSISCSETVSSSSPPKQVFVHIDGRWSEGDKAFPPKKRRGTFESATEDNSNDDDDDDKKNSKKMKMKRMKTKMNRKYSRRGDSNNEGGEEEDENEEEVTRETKPEVLVGKKRVRGGALMEGSRCSRVNGRGWRCCQQTLVGYSLCEHHLGKGRLRSMTSVRNKSIGTSTTSGAPKSNMSKSEPSFEKQTTKSSNVTEDPLENDAENIDEKKPVVVTKRRMKLGMVKARSISSLLGQTNTEMVAIAEDSDNK